MSFGSAMENISWRMYFILSIYLFTYLFSFKQNWKINLGCSKPFFNLAEFVSECSSLPCPFTQGVLNLNVHRNNLGIPLNADSDAGGLGGAQEGARVPDEHPEVSCYWSAGCASRSEAHETPAHNLHLRSTVTLWHFLTSSSFPRQDLLLPHLCSQSILCLCSLRHFMLWLFSLTEAPQSRLCVSHQAAFQKNLSA